MLNNCIFEEEVLAKRETKRERTCLSKKEKERGGKGGGSIIDPGKGT